MSTFYSLCNNHTYHHHSLISHSLERRIAACLENAYTKRCSQSYWIYLRSQTLKTNSMERGDPPSIKKCRRFDLTHRCLCYLQEYWWHLTCTIGINSQAMISRICLTLIHYYCDLNSIYVWAQFELELSLELVDWLSINARPGASKLFVSTLTSFNSLSSFVMFSWFMRW